MIKVSWCRIFSYPIRFIRELPKRLKGNLTYFLIIIWLIYTGLVTKN